MSEKLLEHMKQGAKMDYPLYNVCYNLKSGATKTVRERATLRESLEAIKRFDRVFCSQGELLRDVASIFFEPVKEVKVHDTGELIPI